MNFAAPDSDKDLDLKGAGHRHNGGTVRENSTGIGRSLAETLAPFFVFSARSKLSRCGAEVLAASRWVASRVCFLNQSRRSEYPPFGKIASGRGDRRDWFVVFGHKPWPRRCPGPRTLPQTARPHFSWIAFQHQDWHLAPVSRVERALRVVVDALILVFVVVDLWMFLTLCR